MKNRQLFFIAVVTLCFGITQSANALMQAWFGEFAGAGLTVGINPLNPYTVYAEGVYGQLYVSHDDGATWTYLSSPGLTYIRQIIVHPNDTLTIFGADASSGLRKSTDGGLTWNTVIPNYGIDGESITYDPNHPDTMYAGNFADGRVYRSTNRGSTWTQQGIAGVELCAFSSRPDSANILYGGTGGGSISKSTDAGVTWRVVKPAAGGSVFEEVPKIVIDKSNPQTAYATINGNIPDPNLGIWKTIDGGETWIQLTLPIGNVPMWAMAIDDMNAVYAGTFYSTASSILKTTDGGITWSAPGLGLPPGGFIWSLKAHPLDSLQVWASVTIGDFGANGVYRLFTTNTIVHGAVRDGATGDTIKTGYIKLTNTYDSLNLSSTGGTFTFGAFTGAPCPIGMICIPDVPLSFLGVVAYPYYFFQVDPFVDGMDIHQDIFLTKLPFATVTGSVKDSLQNGVHAILRFSTETAAGPQIIFDSTDATGKFTLSNLYISNPPVINDYSLFVDCDVPFRQLLISPIHLDTLQNAVSTVTSPADIFLVGEDSAQYASYYEQALDSLGIAPYFWNTVIKGPAPFQRGNEFSKKTVIYFSATKHTPLQPAELANFSVSVNNGVNLFITGQDIVEKNDTSVFLKNQLGVQFSANTSVGLCIGTTGDLFDGMNIFTNSGDQTSRDILTSANPKAHTVLAYSGGGNVKTAAFRIDSVGSGSKVVIMGFGFESILNSVPDLRKTIMQQVLGYFNGSIVLGVHDRQPGIPKQFTLEQNYPNPFNPTTSIQVEVAKYGFVTLKIYDLLGSEVATLLNQNLAPGFYNLKWDGSKSASGVYYYRLTTPYFTEVKKMLLLK